MYTKSKFLTFMLALFPGASHMYLGLAKIGASYMVGFFLVIALTTIPGLTLFSFSIPVIWCLAFFDAMNKLGYNQEQLNMVEDKFWFSWVFNKNDEEMKQFMATKWPILLGSALVLAGVYALLQNLLYDVLGGIFGYAEVRRILGYIGTMLVSGVLICAGVWLIRGKKSNGDKKD